MSRLGAVGSYVAAGLALSMLTACSRGEDAERSSGANAAASQAAAPAPVAYASLTGDAAAGERVFVQCRACHTVEPGQNRMGPTLHGVVGKPAGQVPGYNYSPANRNSGITWTEEQLFAFLEAPQRVIPGTKMVFGGIRDPQARADLIAYLKTAS